MSSPSGPARYPTTAVSESIVVSGLVQGVGYRAFSVSHAQRLGLWGLVRNQSDGTVLILVQGLPDAIDTFIEVLQKGPSGSRVDCLLRSSLGVATEPGGPFIIDRECS